LKEEGETLSLAPWLQWLLCEDSLSKLTPAPLNGLSSEGQFRKKLSFWSPAQEISLPWSVRSYEPRGQTPTNRQKLLG